MGEKIDKDEYDADDEYESEEEMAEEEALRKIPKMGIKK